MIQIGKKLLWLMGILEMQIFLCLGEVKKQTIIFQCPITIQKVSLEVMN